ncbi:hypothetical protein ACFVT9_29230 [Kitasatospora cineracea]|uniref:hypothetical protein n=1 Tax=Kitasatospora cineracea TaxID=88074 RepID=UPI0036DBD71F
MTVPVPDLFGHTLAIPAAVREHVSGQAGRALESAAAFVEKTEPGSVLLVAGSLARGEAAVRHHDGRWTLASDLDLAVVPARTRDDVLAELTVHHLASEHPALVPTCFTLAPGARARGHFGADLWLARRNGPLTGTLPAGALPRPATGPREDLELVVHQLATYLLTDSQPDPGARDSAGSRLRKLLLETLRATAPAGGDGITRYRDILSAPAAWNGILDDGEVSGLIEGRELGRPLSLDPARADGALLALLGRFLLPDTGTDPTAAADELRRLTDHAADVLGTFQLAVLAHTGLLLNPDPTPYAEVLLELLARTGTRGGPEPVAGLSPRALAKRRPADLDRVREKLRALRLEYYHALSERNFGRSDDDGRYARLPLARTAATTPGGGNLTRWPAWVERLPRAAVAMPGAVGHIAGQGQGQAVLWSFPDGGTVPAHRHGPQIGVVVTGAVHLERDGEPGTVRIVGAGESFEIHDGQLHAATVEAGTTVIEVFWEGDRHRPTAAVPAAPDEGAAR